MVPNQENMVGDQPVQRHSHAQQPLQPHYLCAEAVSWWNRTSFVIFFRPFWLDCVSQLPQHVGIVFPIDNIWLSEGDQWVQCPLHPRRRRPSPSLPTGTTLAFFGWEERGVFPLHGLSFGLWLEVVNQTLIILGEETFKRTGWICLKKC